MYLDKSKMDFKCFHSKYKNRWGSEKSTGLDFE